MTWIIKSKSLYISHNGRLITGSYEDDRAKLTVTFATTMCPPTVHCVRDSREGLASKLLAALVEERGTTIQSAKRKPARF